MSMVVNGCCWEGECGRFSNIIVVNEGSIRPAKVAVIARGHLTLFVFGLVLCFGSPRL